jgi:hypothetical protein
MIGMIAGSYLGGYLTEMAGASGFDYFYIFGMTVGGLLGIWIAYNFTDLK